MDKEPDIGGLSKAAGIAGTEDLGERLGKGVGYGVLNAPSYGMDAVTYLPRKAGEAFLWQGRQINDFLEGLAKARYREEKK